MPRKGAFPYSDTTSEVGTDYSEQKKQSQMPDAWDLNDDFEYAPPKTRGDPWSYILSPLMEKDQVQCSTWKEEVQNLLIFAGLFSAVVTPFIIESYKLLQPPDQISSRTNASFNTVPFTPSPSAIRINIFWFMSLMLSLATVLIGIIAMQWLRVYQSYPNLSARETLALFHMRAEAFDYWYVSKIFTVLPLLLQVALVLFFGGIIDFLNQLLPEVAIPVTIVIGLTLFFLLATTVAPSIQGLVIYLSVKLSTTPSRPIQCPYKSPQSWAFHSIHHFFIFLLRLVSLRRMCSFLPRFMGESKDQEDGNPLLSCLSTTWQKKSWIDFDMAWLSVRDAYVRQKYDQYIGLRGYRSNLNSNLPLYDITKALRKAIRRGEEVHSTDGWYSIIYHCYHDLSTNFLERNAFVRASNSDVGFDEVQQCYRYFSFLLGIRGPCYHFAIHYKKKRYPKILENIAMDIERTLYNANLYEFLDHSCSLFSSADLQRHKLEIKIRLMRKFYGPPKGYYIRPLRFSIGIPDSIKFSPSEMQELRDDKRQYAAFCWQYYNVLWDFFDYVANARRLDLLPECLHHHPGILGFLQDASQHTYAACSADSVIRLSSEHRQELSKAFGGIFDFIDKQLRHDIWRKKKFDRQSSNYEVRGSPDIREEVGTKFDPLTSMDLFYMAAIYVQHFTNIVKQRHRTSSVDPNVTKLLRTMHEYKLLILGHDEYPSDPHLVQQFNSEPLPVPRFSTQWWTAFLDSNYDRSPVQMSRSASIMSDSLLRGEIRRIPEEQAATEMRQLNVPVGRHNSGGSQDFYPERMVARTRSPDNLSDAALGDISNSVSSIEVRSVFEVGARQHLHFEPQGSSSPIFDQAPSTPERDSAFSSSLSSSSNSSPSPLGGSLRRNHVTSRSASSIPPIIVSSPTSAKKTLPADVDGGKYEHHSYEEDENDSDTLRMS